MDLIKYKHPRIYHVPWSEGLKNDDRMHKNMEIFDGVEVVVTEKMDGENTTMYNNVIYARSVDSQNSNHPSRDRVKKMWGDIRYKITYDDMRLCGENLFAEHSIKYDNLDSYFYLFSVWFGTLSVPWKAIPVYAKKYGFATPKILYQGIYDEEKIKSLYKANSNEEMIVNGNIVEGYVIRPVGGFWHKFDKDENPFCEQYAKFVRKNHVQTDEHWLRSWDKTKVNKLKV